MRAKPTRVASRPTPCDALRSAKSFGSHVAPGKQGLKKIDRKRVLLIACCSVDIDTYGPASTLGVKRWDYVLVHGEDGTGHVVEVHPATTSDVRDVVAKKRWALAVLADEAPGFTVIAWHWIASGRVDVRGQSQRLLSEAGIRYPRARLVL